MQVITDFQATAPYCVDDPARQELPLVLNSPHSGRHYPQAFLKQTRLDHIRVRRSEDAYVDDLFRDCVSLGVPLLSAQFPRVYLDVNREPYELDPKMFSEPLPAYANMRSVRVAGGLGTVPRVVSASEDVYSGPIRVDDALDRIETLYKPYHEALRRLLARTHVAFGYSVLIDCHSMPSNIRGFDGPVQPDIIVGDRFGKSCDCELVNAAERHLTRAGLRVARNKPYAGGFITEHYGRPAQGLHALQIEINRGLYMNEATYAKRPDFQALADVLRSTLSHVGTVARDRLPNDTMQLAAE